MKNGLVSKDFQSRGFQVIAMDKHQRFSVVDGVGQFIYKGYQISFSSIGRSHGGCMNPVEIFTGDDYNTRVQTTGDLCLNGGGFHTVENAIKYIDTILSTKGD